MANGNFGGGDGTKENPFLIEDSYDLLAVAGGYDEDDYEEIEYDEGDDSNKKYYLQIKDIDLKDIPFTPITMFSSVYDGGGYKIKNLSIYDGSSEVGYFGLFSIVADCILTNIHIVNAYIQLFNDSGMFGILAAGADSSLIEKCSVSGKVEIPTMDEDSFFYSNGGGLVGALINSTLKQSHADVSLNALYAGGLMYGTANSLIQDCYVKGSINNSFDAGTLTTLIMEGTEFKNCYGVVKMVDVFVNRPLGYIDGDVVITSCYINGDEFVPEWDETRKYFQGAMVRGTDGAFYRCIEDQNNRNFDVNLIVDPDNFPIDWEDISEIEHFFPRFTKAQPVTGDLWATYWEQYNDDSILKTTSLMKQKATFVDWDFTEIWGIKENETYPFFAEGRRIKCKSLNLPKKLIR